MLITHLNVESNDCLVIFKIFFSLYENFTKVLGSLLTNLLCFCMPLNKELGLFQLNKRFVLWKK